MVSILKTCPALGTFRGLVIAELSPSSDSKASQLQLVSTQQKVGIQQGQTSVSACFLVILNPRNPKARGAWGQQGPGEYVNGVQRFLLKYDMTTIPLNPLGELLTNPRAGDSSILGIAISHLKLISRWILSEQSLYQESLPIIPSL